MKAGATEYILKNHLSRLGPAVERELNEANERREKKKIKQELAASQQLYRIITENMTDTVWIMDIKTQKITYLNPAAIKSFGYSIKELEKFNHKPYSHSRICQPAALANEKRCNRWGT